jgi:NADH-quinone oxidoreductase subunit J
MKLLFILIASITVGSALAAISLRNLVHCALCFATSLLGVAGLFLWLGAQFIGFAQILVYVGAISILVVFAILLTRGAGNEEGQRVYGSALVGGATALLVGALLVTCILSSSISALVPKLKTDKPPIVVLTKTPTVEVIGTKLMTTHIIALELIALALTVALLGAVTIAMPERKKA